MANKKQNFLSVDRRTARSSYDQYFTIGEIVAHQDKEEGKASIMRFDTSVDDNEIIVTTSKGTARLDFLEKLD